MLHPEFESVADDKRLSPLRDSLLLLIEPKELRSPYQLFRSFSIKLG